MGDCIFNGTTTSTGQTQGPIDVAFILTYRDLATILTQNPNENNNGIVDRFDIDYWYNQYHLAQIQGYDPTSDTSAILQPIVVDVVGRGYLWITIVYQEAPIAEEHYPRTLIPPSE